MEYLNYGIIDNYTGTETNDFMSVVVNWTTINGHPAPIDTFRPIILIF